MKANLDFNCPSNWLRKISDFVYEYNYHYISFQVKHQIDRTGDEIWNGSMNWVDISNKKRRDTQRKRRREKKTQNIIELLISYRNVIVRHTHVHFLEQIYTNLIVIFDYYYFFVCLSFCAFSSLFDRIFLNKIKEQQKYPKISLVIYATLNGFDTSWNWLKYSD